MKINTLREWLIHKEGAVGGAYGKEATIGDLMNVVQLLIAKEESN